MHHNPSSFSFMNHEINQEEKRKKEIQGVLDHEKTCQLFRLLSPSIPSLLLFLHFLSFPFPSLLVLSCPPILEEKTSPFPRPVPHSLDQKKSIKGTNFSEIFFTNCYFSNFHFQTLSNSNSNQSPK